MKKITTWILLLAFSTVHSPNFLQADSAGQPMEITKETQEASTQGEVRSLDVEEEDAEPQGAPVSPSSNVTKNAKKKELVRNLFLAGTAIAIAVVSMIIVSNNNGKNP